MSNFNRTYTWGSSYTLSGNVTVPTSGGVTITVQTSSSIDLTKGNGNYNVIPSSGSIAIRHSGVNYWINYTGKTSSTLTGCTRPAGSVSLTAGDIMGNGDSSTYGMFQDIIVTSTSYNPQVNPTDSSVAGAVPGIYANQAHVPDLVFFDERPLVKMPNLSQVQPGTYSYWIDDTLTGASNGTLYISENPSGHTVEWSVFENAIFANGTNANGCKLYGMGITHYANQYNGISDGVHYSAAILITGGNSITIESCIIAWNNTGISLTSSNGTGQVIKNNVFIHNAHLHMHVNANVLRLESNRMQYGNWKRLDHHGSGFSQVAAVKMSNMNSQSLMINNIISDNYANGMWYDVGSDDAIWANNLVERNHSYGLNYEVSVRGTIINNISSRNFNSGIKIADSAEPTATLDNSGALVWNNTCFSNGTNAQYSLVAVEFFIYDDSRTNSGGFASLVMDKTECFNNVFIMDHLVTQYGGAGPSECVNLYDASTNHTNTASAMWSRGHDNNFWVRNSGFTGTGTPYCRYSNPGATQSTATTLAGLKAMDSVSAGHENNSTVLDGSTISGVLTDYANYNWTLVNGIGYPSPKALSTTCRTRLASLGATTPAVVGASDALAATINSQMGVTLYGNAITTLPSITIV
jgi:hypothetical protein